ncbi:hypothetical protein T10_11928 [Trichinella papuae]|uniref:Uncharacterized protein n=1 Tax=Trichinella papuae TaxID=268474 RepID=A0A0V1N1S4_9BILA|nr:hypothetical protein T10_11928 [Trichinella papuae]
MHEVYVSVIPPRKEEDSLAENEEALKNFEDIECAYPGRPDLPYNNPQTEDSHPFPLMISELASGHQNNVSPSPPA